MCSGPVVSPLFSDHDKADSNWPGVCTQLSTRFLILLRHKLYRWPILQTVPVCFNGLGKSDYSNATQCSNYSFLATRMKSDPNMFTSAGQFLGQQQSHSPLPHKNPICWTSNYSMQLCGKYSCFLHIIGSRPVPTAPSSLSTKLLAGRTHFRLQQKTVFFLKALIHSATIMLSHREFLSCWWKTAFATLDKSQQDILWCFP